MAIKSFGIFESFHSYKFIYFIKSYTLKIHSIWINISAPPFCFYSIEISLQILEMELYGITEYVRQKGPPGPSSETVLRILFCKMIFDVACWKNMHLSIKCWQMCNRPFYNIKDWTVSAMLLLLFSYRKSEGWYITVKDAFGKTACSAQPSWLAEIVQNLSAFKWMHITDSLRRSDLIPNLCWWNCSGKGTKR